MLDGIDVISVVVPKHDDSVKKILDNLKAQE